MKATESTDRIYVDAAYLCATTTGIIVWLEACTLHIMRCYAIKHHYYSRLKCALYIVTFLCYKEYSKYHHYSGNILATLDNDWNYFG